MEAVRAEAESSVALTGAGGPERSDQRGPSADGGDGLSLPGYGPPPRSRYQFGGTWRIISTLHQPFMKLASVHVVLLGRCFGGKLWGMGGDAYIGRLF